MAPEFSSRFALLRQGIGLETLAFTLGLLALIAFVIPRLIAAARPVPLPIRPWSPLPADLPRRGATTPYGAPALKASYRGALTRGLATAGLGHVALILALSLLLAPQAGNVDGGVVIDSFDVEVHGPGATIQPAPEIESGRGGGGAPIVIPSIHTLFRPVPDNQARRLFLDPDPDDLLTQIGDDEKGSAFGTGGDGPPGNGWSNAPSIGGSPEFDDDPDPGEIRPVESLPILVTMPEPDYPTMARLAGVEGRVELLLLVGRNGHVREVRVRKSVPGLDESAIAAARQAIFRPALWRRQPVSVWVAMPLAYRLHE